MKINPSLSGTRNVIELIRESNPQFIYNELLIKITHVEARLPDVVPYNTTAKVEGRNPADNFFNPVNVYYNRRSMKEAKETPTTFLNADASTTFDDLLNFIANELKLVKEEFEFVDFNTEIGSTVSTVVLKPVEASRLYTPESLTITLLWGGDALPFVPLLPAASKLHQLMHEKFPAPEYF